MIRHGGLWPNAPLRDQFSHRLVTLSGFKDFLPWTLVLTLHSLLVWEIRAAPFCVSPPPFCSPIRKVKVVRDAAHTRAAKAMYDSQYRSLHRDIKRSCYSDKRNWTSCITCQVEVASRENNLRELYKLSRVLTEKNGSANHHIKEENGALITYERDQLARWFKHFSGVLNIIVTNSLNFHSINLTT